MTREFKTHRRDDSPMPPRNKPAGRYGETRPPRPGRHRLSRTEVDRGWESGAQINHADYRSRNGNGQVSHNDRRHYQSPTRASSHNASGNFRSEGNRGRSYDNRRDGYQDGYPRDRFADASRHSPHERRFDERDQQRSGRGRDVERDRRPAREYDRRAPRTYERRGNRPFGQDRSPARNSPGQTPPRRPRPFTGPFEGDYERFSDDEPSYPPTPSSGKPFQRGRGQRTAPEQAPVERHVTRLPDGRVLKGPRPVQRRNAEFWMEIAEDTEDLVGHVQTPVPPPAKGKRAAGKSERKKYGAPPPSARAQAPAPRKGGPRPVSTYRKAGPAASRPRSAFTRPLQRGPERPGR